MSTSVVTTPFAMGAWNCRKAVSYLGRSFGDKTMLKLVGDSPHCIEEFDICILMSSPIALCLQRKTCQSL